MRAFFAIGFALGLTALVSGCSEMPTEGPTTREIVTPVETAGYAVVPVDARLAELLSKPTIGGLGARFSPTAVAPPTNRVGIGDVMRIRILEAGREQLFSQSGADGGAFPGITVDPHGSITLPYVGSLAVAGKTPEQIESAIVEALQGRAIEPQAIVTVGATNNNTVTINGTAARSGVYPLTLRPMKIGQAIALAGGSVFPDYETQVTLVRTGRRAASRLDQVLLNPAQNLLLQRDDEIVLSHKPETYTITGAVARSGTFKFNGPSISLLEAVSAAGGLVHVQADPSGVFVFRRERPALLREAGVTDLARFGARPAAIPTIYHIDMQDVSARFYAQTFQLRDGDAVYVANSGAVQLAKFIALLRSGLGAGLTANTLAN